MRCERLVCPEIAAHYLLSPVATPDDVPYLFVAYVYLCHHPCIRGPVLIFWYSTWRSSRLSNLTRVVVMLAKTVKRRMPGDNKPKYVLTLHSHNQGDCAPGVVGKLA